VSLIRESVEEYSKYKFDREVNAIECEVWQIDQKTKEGSWVRLKSEELRVGMVCRIYDDEMLPADMIALRTSKPEGILYLETSGLDG
jgi:magnesium-transporting ATPase (P-type)